VHFDDDDDDDEDDYDDAITIWQSLYVSSIVVRRPY
jgi:hypothetical protein